MASNYLNLLISGGGCPPELAAIIADNTGVIRPDGQKAWDVDAQGDFVQQATYGGSIELTNDNTSVAQSYAAAVTAAGSTISDATQLAKVNNNVTVTGAAGVGVKLFDGPIGTTIRVRNERSLPVNVYPPTASVAINSFAVGAPIIISYNDYAEFTKISATQWIAQMGSALDASSALTATGTIITDALDLFNPVNNVTTVAAGTGVQLYEAAIGASIKVRNGGNNTLQVYPPSASGTLNNLSAGIAFPVNSQVVATFTKATATAWIVELGACQGVENGITASGTIITDAYDLTRAVNVATTVGANSGVQLFAATIGVPVYVGNGQAVNALKVYPPDASSTFNGLGGGVAVSLAASTGGTFVRLTSTAWVFC